MPGICQQTDLRTGVSKTENIALEREIGKLKGIVIHSRPWDSHSMILPHCLHLSAFGEPLVLARIVIVIGRL